MSPDQAAGFTKLTEQLPDGWQLDLCLARHQTVVRLVDDQGRDALVLDTKPGDPTSLAFLLDAVQMHLINVGQRCRLAKSAAE